MLRVRTAIPTVAVASVLLLIALVARWDSAPDSAFASTSDCTNGVAVPDPANNPGLVSDCEALLAARDTLAGSGTLDWSADTSIYDWVGVTVSNDSLRVVDLYLSWRGLTGGSIPWELGHLSNLRRLSLAGNELTGPIPAELVRLSDLEYLVLEHNRLTESIPSSLGSLSKLQSMSLGGNRLSGEIPASLGKLSSLQWVSLENNQLTGPIPSALGGLSGLVFLEFDNNRLTGEIPSELARLSNVEVLDLSHNQLTGSIPPELGHLSKVVVLGLNRNRLTGQVPSSLVSLSTLEHLELAGNPLTGCVPDVLRSVDYNDLTGLSLPTCVAPTTSISAAPKRIPVRINSPIPVTTWFSEPVINFTIDDVTVTNGSATSFSGTDGEMVYTFDVTPTGIGEVTVDILSGVAGDADGTGYGNTPAHLSLGIPHDDDRDGVIGLDEAIAALEDYFSGDLAIEHAIAIVQLYFSSSN